MARLILVAAIVAGVVDVLPARAQQEAPKYEVTGFRDARFGMTEAEVRAIVTKAFNVKGTDIASSVNSIEGTNVLTVAVPSLDPGPGAARVAYIFGNKSKKLIQVNVVWGEVASTPPVDPNAMITAGTRLERYLAGLSGRRTRSAPAFPLATIRLCCSPARMRRRGRSG
jgi:hypothetical protein